MCRNREDLSAVVSSATDIFITAQGDCVRFNFYSSFLTRFLWEIIQSRLQRYEKNHAHRLGAMLLHWAFEQAPDTKMEEEITK